MLGPLEQAAMGQIMAEEKERQATMTRSWDAYNGRFPDPFKVEPGKPNDNVKVNRVQAVIDASASLLFGELPDWELPKEADGENGAEPSKKERMLEQCLDLTGFAAKMLDYAINGGITGTPYLRVIPGKPFPRLQVVDPTCMSIRWNPLDIDEVDAYIWQFNTIDEKSRPIIRQQLCERDGERWKITDRHAELGVAQFNQWIVDGFTYWNYSWPPYIHNKNLPNPNHVYGLADYGDVVIELNKAKNYALSNRLKIDRLHGHPKLWGRGVNSDGISFGPEDMLLLDEESAEVGQLAPTVASDASSGLGREIDQSIEMASFTPSLLLGRDDGQPLPMSGRALKLRMWPATMRLTMKRTLYGPMLIELFRRLLELMGQGDNNIVVLKWAEPLPVDSMEERQVMLIDQQLGVASKSSIAEKLGYDWETERDNLEQETADLGEKALNDFTNAPGANMQPGQPAKPVDRPNGIEGI